jgi:hypothetical protein
MFGEIENAVRSLGDRIAEAVVEGFEKGAKILGDINRS